MGLARAASDSVFFRKNDILNVKLLLFAFNLLSRVLLQVSVLNSKVKLIHMYHRIAFLNILNVYDSWKTHQHSFKTSIMIKCPIQAKSYISVYIYIIDLNGGCTFMNGNLTLRETLMKMLTFQDGSFNV